MTTAAQLNIKVQRTITWIAVVLFFIKLTAYYLTKSVAILSDALESIVNIVAAFIGLYSLHISAMPRDEDHPYGHGKVEYLSSAIEGVLIVVAGFTILYSAIQNLIVSKPIKKIDYGILLIVITAVVNFVVGVWCKNIGKKNNSLALQSSGTHLITDTWTTIGIIVGLVLVYITNLQWIDCIVAIVVSVIILKTGFIILKSSVEGIMDKADIALLEKIINTIEKNRSPNWIDLHNLRVLKYGSVLHLDGHLTVPWYFTVNEAHIEVSAIEALVKQHFGETVELFIHTDGCMEFSCSICTVSQCTHRKKDFSQKEIWDTQNVLRNKKHGEK